MKRENKGMNQLPLAKRILVIRMITEGSSMRTASRVAGASINTVIKLVCEVGEACADYQHRQLRDLKCTELRLNEIHTFVGCREQNKKNAITGYVGDVWTWTALCPQTKLIPAWLVGDRSAMTAMEFCLDLGTRFKGRLQIIPDGLPAYRFAAQAGFGDVDFAQLVKIYGRNEEGEEVVIRTEKKVISGNPDMNKVSPSLVERSNLTLRMCARRFTRLTNGFSKKIENHTYALGLHFFIYNFCREHLTINTTPALAAGVDDKVWSVEDVIYMADEYWTAKRPIQRPKVYRKRMTPKTYPPQTPKTPWYLDPNGQKPENSE